jgi:spoIIIJ-associated protein
MTERTTLEIIAPTVEEALAQGLAQLGLPAEAVSVEVLDAGNRGLFGLGGRQVRVRLTVNPPGGPPPRPAPAPEEKRAAAPEKSRSRPKREAAAQAPRERSKPARSPAPKPAARAEAFPEGPDPTLETTEATISKLLFHMGLEAQVSAHYGEVERDDRRPIMVDIRGEDLGVLIGRRGEMLNAFQYVAALMVGKETGQFIHLVVDVEGHRDRRERQLRQLARRMAEQVIKSGRKLTLEPMSAAERRIIHMELREHPAVRTESNGEEPHRKITILLKE